MQNQPINDSRSMFGADWRRANMAIISIFGNRLEPPGPWLEKSAIYINWTTASGPSCMEVIPVVILMALNH